MAASNDAKFARGLGEHGWQVLRPGTEPGSQRNHEAAEQAPTAKAIDDLAAPVGRGQHDGPSDTVRVVFGQISPQNQAPERMGHKVDLVAVQCAALVDCLFYFGYDRFDGIRPAWIAEVENPVTSLYQALCQRIHAPGATTQAVQKNHRIR